jgi:hypothetical protein
MSPDRDIIACPLPRLPDLGAMASVFSALASEAVCLNASRILAGGDRGDERQNHNDNLDHRCQLSVYENVGDLGKKAERNPGCRVTSGATRVLSVKFYPLATPNERGGNRYVRPTATAPHLDSTNCRDPAVIREGQLHPSKPTNPPARSIVSSVPIADIWRTPHEPPLSNPWQLSSVDDGSCPFPDLAPVYGSADQAKP